MISREEFNHQLQTGKVREALVSVLHSLNELDVTTQIATDSLTERLRQRAVGNACAQRNRPYIRTTIDLLNGRVIDEVSANFADGNSDPDLQQLHAERVAASYDLVRDYLTRIESLLGTMSAPNADSDTARMQPDRMQAEGVGEATPSLQPIADRELPARDVTETAIDPTIQAPPTARFHPLLGETHAEGTSARFHPLRERTLPQSEQFDKLSAARAANVPPKSPPPALVAKLQQARASLTSRLGGDTPPAMLFPSRTVETAPIVSADLDRVDFDDESDDMAIVLPTPPIQDGGLSEDDLAAVATIVDEEIDLAIAQSAGYANEENGELWAGWVEEDSDDEDEYSLEVLSPQPPANPTLLDWQEIPTPKYVDAIEVKPIISRPVAQSLDPISQWDKFEPDYLGIDFDPQPAIKKDLPIDN